MSYANAFRTPQDPANYGYADGYAETIEGMAPTSPWQQPTAADPGWTAPPEPVWGAGGVGDVLGGLGSQVGRQIIQDPYVQAEIEKLKAEFKVKEQSGVTEWMEENKMWIVAGGLGLLLGNFLMLTVGVLPAVERSVNKARRGGGNRW